jgi:hypothetical protein
MSISLSTTVYTPTLPIPDLERFLDETESLLDNITGPWSPLLFRRDDRQILADAWDEVKRTSLPQVRQNLFNNPPGLAAAGLARGTAQLALKLKGLNDAWQAFFDRGSVRLLKKVLDWINAILGSIASIVPGGEGIQELKEAIEKLFTDGED